LGFKTNQIGILCGQLLILWFRSIRSFYILSAVSSVFTGLLKCSGVLTAEEVNEIGGKGQRVWQWSM
jgi:hypothetical protein